MVALGIGAVVAGAGIAMKALAAKAAGTAALTATGIGASIATQLGQAGIATAAFTGLGIVGLAIAGAEHEAARIKPENVEDSSDTGEKAKSSITWNCWKAILHEWESPLRGGMLLEDILIDGRVRRVEILDAEKQAPKGLHIADWPELVVENVWGESFHIYYVWVLGGYDMPAAHCVKLEK